MVSFRGLMRGAAQAGTRRLQSVNYLDEQGIEQIAQTFQKTAPKIQEEQQKAQKGIDDINTLANSLGINPDVVAHTMKVYGNDRAKTMTHLINLKKHFKGKPIPVTAIEQTDQMLTKPEVTEAKVDAVVPETKTDDEFKFTSLFKTRGREDLINEFINRNPGLDPQTVKNVLAGNYDLPQFTPTTQISSDVFMKGFEGATGKLGDLYKTSFARFKKLDDQLITKPGAFSEANKNLILKLRPKFTEFQNALIDNDKTKADSLFQEITKLGFNNITTLQEDSSSKPTEKYKIIFNRMVARFPNQTKEFHTQKTEEFLASDVIFSGNSAFKKIIDPNGNAALIPMYVIRNGNETISNDKVYKKTLSSIQKGTNNFAKIFRLRNTLEKIPNAFSIEGQFRQGVTGFLGLFGSEDWAKSVGGADIIMSQQDRISFVSSVKDELFDDPRLSDQDLRLVLNYIAILDNPLASKPLARAALLGIERALVNSQAMNIAQLYPNLTAAAYDSDGDIDFKKDSVAVRLHNNLMTAAFGPNHKKKYEKMNAKQQERYKLIALQNYKVVQNSVGAVNAFQSNVDNAEFKFRSKNLFDITKAPKFSTAAVGHADAFNKVLKEYEKVKAKRLQES